jgi:hypothetical protein
MWPIMGYNDLMKGHEKMVTSKRTPIKVYFEPSDKFLSRIERVAANTGLSLSAVASLAIRQGLPVVENLAGSQMELPIKTRKVKKAKQ